MAEEADDVLVTLPNEEELYRRLLQRCGDSESTRRIYEQLHHDASREEVGPEGVVNIVVAAISAVVANLSLTPSMPETDDAASKLTAMHAALNAQFEAILSALLDGEALKLAIAYYKHLR